MMSSCPITGEVSEIIETTNQVSVEHPEFGRFVLDADALKLLSDSPDTKSNMAKWISEFHSLELPIPRITAEHVLFSQRLTNLEDTIMEWSSLQTIMQSSSEQELWKKLKLEWSYNSNHIEGNTLTYHETELLLIYDRTAGGHRMRDYEEMKAHSVAIDHVYALARQERALAAIDIRDINRIILKEPFWINTETPDGHPTRKRIVPGEYKTQPNHVRTSTGELHRFAEPEDTPALMETWVDRFRATFDKVPYPLPLFLAESHWSLLRIHPFDDGNGRTARLLSNYMLLRNDLLPIVIKAEERDRYIGGLQNADTGRMLPLAEFMLDNLMWSLQLGMRAAKGESIWELVDIDKEVDVFVRSKRSQAPSESDLEAVDEVVLIHVRPTLDKLGDTLDRLSELFHTFNTNSFLKIGESTLSMTRLFEPRNWEPRRQQRLANPGFHLADERLLELGTNFGFYNYVGVGKRDFNLNISLTWRLGKKSFSLEANVDGRNVLRDIDQSTLYSETHKSSARIDIRVREICNAAMGKIEERTGEVEKGK